MNLKGLWLRSFLGTVISPVDQVSNGMAPADAGFGYPQPDTVDGVLTVPLYGGRYSCVHVVALPTVTQLYKYIETLQNRTRVADLENKKKSTLFNQDRRPWSMQLSSFSSAAPFRIPHRPLWSKSAGTSWRHLSYQPYRESPGFHCRHWRLA